MNIKNITIYWPDLIPEDIEEVKFSYSFCYQKSQTLCAADDLRITWVKYSPDTTMHSLLSRTDSDFILVVGDPEIVFTSGSVRSLMQTAETHSAAAGPVYNLPGFPEQQAFLSTTYLNMSSFTEMEREIYDDAGFEQEVVTLDPSLVVFPMSLLKNMDEELLDITYRDFLQLKYRKYVDKRALVHRFGEYYNSERLDLISLIPENISFLLDAGCARGIYGKSLKKFRPEIEVTGVEMNPEMAAEAGKYYDRIFNGRIEDFHSDRGFDLINCGDMIEHLHDPWAVLRRFYELLSPSGFLVLSLPNAGHWTMVSDLLLGKFEYIPVGIQCIGHIRWFTEDSIKQALMESGFAVDVLQREILPPTRNGAEFIQRMVKAGYGNEQALLTKGMIIRARKIWISPQ